MKDRQTRPAQPDQHAKPTRQGSEYMTAGIRRGLPPVVVDKEAVQQLRGIERNRIGGC